MDGARWNNARALQLRAPHLLLARRSAQTLLSQLGGYITGVANGGSGGGGGGSGGGGGGGGGRGGYASSLRLPSPSTGGPRRAKYDR